MIKKLHARKMAQREMTMGKGAIILVLSSSLHPLQHIKTMRPYVGKYHRVVNLFVLHQEMRKINRENTNLYYAAECFCILQREEYPDFLFTGAPVEEILEAFLPQIVPREIQNTTECGHVQQDDIIIAQNLVKIDKHNAENSPQAGEGEWEHPFE
jgi:hypothetical protein